MKYIDILKAIAKKENVSINQVEKEMQEALALTGITCTPQEFIENTANAIKKKTIYSN